MSIKDRIKRRLVSEETITELSKKTLSSYVKSAAGSMAGSAVEHGASITAASPAGDQKSYKKVTNRIKGIIRAANKMVKEETLTEAKKSQWAHQDVDFKKIKGGWDHGGYNHDPAWAVHYKGVHVGHMVTNDDVLHHIGAGRISYGTSHKTRYTYHPLNATTHERKHKYHAWNKDDLSHHVADREEKGPIHEETLTEGGYFVHHKVTGKIAKQTVGYSAAEKHAEKLNQKDGGDHWTVNSHEYWQDKILPKLKSMKESTMVTESDNLKSGERVRIEGHEVHDGKTGEIFGRDKELHKVKIDGEDHQPWIHKAQLTRLGEETIIESRGKTIDKIKDAYGNQYEHRTDVFHGTDAVVKTHQHGEKLEQDHHIHMGKSAYVRAKWKETKKHVDLVNAGTISFPGAKRQQ